MGIASGGIASLNHRLPAGKPPASFGRAVARLIPFAKPSRVELVEIFRRMDEFRANHPLNPKGLEKLTYRDLIEGGRKR